MIARVRELVAGIWKEAKVEMYGSCYTGVCIKRPSWRGMLVLSFPGRPQFT